MAEKPVLEAITKDGWKDLEVGCDSTRLFANGDKRLIYNSSSDSISHMYDISDKHLKPLKIPENYAKPVITSSSNVL